MTPEEIEKAYDEKYSVPNNRSVGTVHRIGVDIAIDFALDMVQRHNEECAKIADVYANVDDMRVSSRHVSSCIAQDIRGVKP